MKVSLPFPKSAAAAGVHPLMRAEAVKRAYLLKLHALLTQYDRDIAQALNGLPEEYAKAEREGYRWRLTRDFRA